VISRRQQQALQRQLSEHYPVSVTVALGMRYGQPSIEQALEELKAANARRILVLPLYPQYASSTTGSTFEAVSRVLGRWRWVPELRFIGSYHDHPGYIEALANSIREHFEARGRPEKLLMSFHGIPRVTQEDGDPYLCQCHKTARLLAERLGLAEGEYRVSFQSRFGKAEWIQPYTSESLTQYASEGVKRVAVVTPGFSADCLETLEEIADENREVFLEAGGEAYDYIPALNERGDHIQALMALIEANLGGWAEAVADRNSSLKQSAEAAARLGASPR
jgi:ferrochelatase